MRRDDASFELYVPSLAFFDSILSWAGFLPSRPLPRWDEQTAQARRESR